MHPRTRQILWALLAVAALAPTTAGCVGQRCDTHGQAPQLYTEGQTNEQRTFYQSSENEGPYLFFPAGRTYRFEHNLSETPAVYGVYLSWVENPLQDGAGVAESAGNQAMFETINERFIEVRNDTCAEFYLRLWASVAPFETSANPPLPSASPATDTTSQDAAVQNTASQDGASEEAGANADAGL